MTRISVLLTTVDDGRFVRHGEGACSKDDFLRKKLLNFHCRFCVVVKWYLRLI